MTDAARSSSRMGWLALGSLGGRRRSSDQESTGGRGTARPRGRLFRKYVLLIVGLVSLVLLLNSALDFWFSYEENKAALFRIQQEKAGSAARRIEQFIDEIERQLGWTTAPQWAASPLEQRRFDYVRLLRQAPAITELIQLDDAGKEQLKVSRLAMDVVGSEKDYSQSPSFVEAKKHRVWFSPVYLRKESEPYMTMAMARTGRNAGVTIAEVDLKLIWDVITGLKIGQSGYAYVVDREGRLIAYPDISLVLRNTDLAKLPQVASALAEAPSLPSPAGGGGSGWGQPIDQAVMVAKGIDGKPVLTAHAAIAPLGWTVFVELPLNEALAPLYGSMLRTCALLALALVLATLAALLLARRMTVPIRELQAGAARIGAGELDRRIDIHTGDELEGLAGEFNRMAVDLQKSYAELEKKVEDRTAELKEALGQQTATAEVLQVINSSPGDLAPVFDAMLERATRLCEADFGILLTYEEDCYRAAAFHNVPPAYAAVLREPIRPGAKTALARVARGEAAAQIADIAADKELLSEPMVRGALEVAGFRTVLAVPLRTEYALLGAFTIYRQEVRPFTEKQIALLQNFAAQAVIAMENARLITETREALEQQTATAEVLQVINSSPGDLTPVFDAMLEKALTLCDASFGQLVTFDGASFRAAAWRGYEPGPNATTPTPGMALYELVHGEQVVHIPDITADDVYRSGNSVRRRLADRYGARTAIWVALKKDSALLGAFVIYRTEVRPFTNKQIALLQNFAAQAVIAMENARLITETREALEQQTATAEVLQVINSSPGDLAPVFDAMLEKAHTLCGAAHGSLQLYDGENLHAVATHAVSDKFADILRQGYRAADSPASQALIEGKPFAHIADCAEIDHPVFRSAAELAGIRTVLFVPLRKDGAFLGLISAARLEVRPFSEKEIALLQNFAAQAVVAMENARLITETREALEQQTATAEVLQVINSSPGDVAPVFKEMLEKASRLCDAPSGIFWSFDGEFSRAAALHGIPNLFAEYLRDPIPLDPETGLGRVRQGERVAVSVDLAAEEPYRAGNPQRRAFVDLGRARSAVRVPLIKDSKPLGTFTVYRQEVRPFTDKQIALLQNFGAQAVIAIENARLITETREALEQQTATAEVLQVINSSPGDLAPVFDAMLEKALALCGAAFGGLWTFDGERFPIAAVRGVPPALTEYFREPLPALGVLDDIVRGAAIMQMADVAEDEVYRSGPPARRALADLGGARTTVWVALRKEEKLLGLISIYRQEVRPFTDKQIALLQNFAAQAVIAMENARLITETREALEQQTATAEVLQVINSSPGDLTPVFDAMLERAMRLCGGSFGVFATYEGEYYRVAATRGLPPGLAEFVRDPIPIQPASMPELLRRGEDIIQIPDIAALGSEHRTPGLVAMIELGNARTAVWVALHKDGVAEGFFGVYRQEVRPFSEKEIALLENFAAQAVIAMENARLVTETREALEQQTATAEVLQVINSSPGDLAPVFDAMLEKALRLCGGSFGELRTYDGNRFRLAATQGVPTAYLEHYSSSDSGIYGPGTGPARILAGERVVHIPDLIATEPYQRGDPDRVALVDLGGARAYLLVPLLKDGAVLGYIMIYRMEVGPFSDKQTALLQNFAAQAVIAMENARLVTETGEALEQQTATAEVLGVINSSPGDLAPVIDAMLEKAMRLCEADFGGLWAFEGERYVAVAQRGVPKAYSEFLANTSLDPPGPGTGAYRLRQGELVVHNIDLTAEEVYRTGEPNRRALVDLGGARTALQVPLRKDDAVLGVITIYRQEVRPFTDQQITLVQNFAAQAVIAMENARLLTETREALEQQTATAEVLQVINSSPGDLAPVFDTILQKAHSLCGIAHGSLQLYEDGQLRAVAMRGVPEPLASRLRQPHPLGPGPARLLAGGRFHQLTEPAEESAWAAHGIRTRLFVPLRQDEAFLGMIVAGRDEVRAFSDKEVALLENFAAQAVIAMENARLLTETREALEQQTATAEVLQVINSSPGDLAPVFDAMLEKATHLCEASFGVLCTYDGASFRATALREVPAAYARFLTAGPLQPGPGNGLARVAAGEKVVHVLDVAAEDTYRSGETLRRALVDLGGARTTLTVALPKDDALLGAFIIYRHEVRPFTEKQIALVQNFAAQAVIAMENVRLITELRQRTHDLQESLEYQTASSDVLKVISRSGAELGPVLDTLVETAAHICRADSGFIFRLQDGLCRMVAGFGIPAEYKDFQERNPIAPGRGTLAGRTVLERRAVHIDDAATDPEYTRRQAVQQGRQRTMLGVPLIRDDMLIGVITLARSYVEPFSEKQIGLVSTFADQAVIAIENARLFGELRARTEELGTSVAELKMLSEVGQAVSSTLDLRAVLSTILNASLGVTWANAGAIFRYIRAERAFRLVEAVGWDEPLLRSVRDLRVAEAETAMGEAAARRMPIQLAELAERPSAPLRDASLAAGFHSALIVPLVGAERILGAIILMRQEAGEFPAETVRLMQTLASQSVLAIQNARLFREIADKSEQLALASQHKSQFLANMSHELRTPLNAILGYAELLVDGIYGVLPDRPRGVLDRIQNNGKHLLALINEVLDLAKIEAGQLTLTLEDYSVPEVVKSVVTATEPLATSKGLKFTAALQDGLPMAHGDARRVSQVLLNLVGNAIKFTDKGEVEIRAIVAKGQFVLTVRDTGPGIADADQDRIFGEFQQIDNSNTRKKGGTGLGLAISKRMVEMQGGTISVDSVLGQGSTFRVVLPVHVDEMMEAA